MLRGWAVTRGVVTVDRAMRLRAPFSEQYRQSHLGTVMRVPPHWDKQRGGCDGVCPINVEGDTSQWAGVWN